MVIKGGTEIDAEASITEFQAAGEPRGETETATDKFMSSALERDDLWSKFSEWLSTS